MLTPSGTPLESHRMTQDEPQRNKGQLTHDELLTLQSELAKARKAMLRINERTLALYHDMLDKQILSESVREWERNR
jgi:hypothetical protein